MKKVLSVLVCILLTIPAFATGDATPTSKGYVDAQMDTLQDNLPAAATNTVVTTTATAGETGTKSIYDASGNYAEQMDALVTAEDANTAIQMAIQGELVCREYDPTGQYCYVYDVIQHGNLFRGPYLGGISSDIARLASNYTTISSPYEPGLRFHGPVFVATVEPRAKYHISGTTDATYSWYAFYASESDISSKDKVIAHYSGGRNTDIVVPDGATRLVLSYSNADTRPITWSNVRLERIYLPSGN